MATKRSGAGSVDPPAPKRTKRETQAEILENKSASIATEVVELRDHLLKSLGSAAGNPELDFFSMRAYTVGTKISFFRLGTTISKPPPVSNPTYGPCPYPLPPELT